MLLEILGVAGGLLSAAEAVDNNDTKREVAANQLKAAELAKAQKESEQKHETTMALINGVFDLLSSYGSSTK